MNYVTLKQLYIKFQIFLINKRAKAVKLNLNNIDKQIRELKKQFEIIQSKEHN